MPPKYYVWDCFDIFKLKAKQIVFFVLHFTACYIDIEDDDDDDNAAKREENNKNKIYSNWHSLPDLVLEQIFTYLTPRERYYAGLVRFIIK